MYLIYNLLYFAALLFMLPFEYFKRPAEIRGRWFRERFGFIDSSLPTPDSSLIWIHAVSVGEVITSVTLIKKLKVKYPSVRIVISTVTDTGQKIARERAGDLADIVYVPFDLPFILQNAFRHISPSLFIIMETELWPNIIRILSSHKVPIVLMNGRISERSFAGYRKLGFFMKGVLNNINSFCVQNELYADRIKALGVAEEKVTVIGSFKFDTRPSTAVPEWTRTLKGPVVIAGSTHKPEEDLIIEAYIKLKPDFPDLNLVLAPRHPERFREVEELVRKKGLECQKRSEVRIQNPPTVGAQASGSTEGTEGTVPDLRSEQGELVESGLSPWHRSSGLVVLLDVIGELSSVYGACDVAIMGGTFIEHGGQNPLEPAYWSRAIVCGPHMENFPFIDDFYSGGGALKTDAAGLHLTLKGLIEAPEKMSAMGKIAKGLYEKNSGATDRALEIIERYLHLPS